MISAQTTHAGRAPRTMVARGARALSALAGFIIVILVAAPTAQQPPPAFAAAPAPIMSGRDGSTVPSPIDLLVGRSTILNHATPIVRVSLTVPDIADAMVTSPSQLLIHGKQPGTISLFVWDRSGAITTYEVTVRRDLSALADHLKQLFPGEDISVMGSGKDVVVSGTVSSKYVIDKAADVAGGYVEKKENVVNLLKQQEGAASNQVMLRVRFAEVSRTALTELGANFFTGPTGYKDWVARSTTQQFAAPGYEDMTRSADLGGNLTGAGGKLSMSDFLNLFIFNNKYNIGTVIRALSEKGLFQSLAEPNLIATNGKEASFLAGGEYPYPVVQPGSGGNSVTIMFKEFGVRLNFTPTVLGGDLINLKVRPEVSALDFSNAITLQGFRVPALSTRRTETEVELRDGQTFAIAGLLNNTVTDSMRKIPGIGDVPVLGWLFKSKAMQKAQTELVVMITPTIIRRGSMGVSEGLPSPVEPWLGTPAKTLPPPDPYVGSPRFPANQPKPGPRSNSETVPASNDQGLTPSAAATAPADAPKPAQPKPVPSKPNMTGDSDPAPAPLIASQQSPTGNQQSAISSQNSAMPVAPVAPALLPSPLQLPSSRYDPAPIPVAPSPPLAPSPAPPVVVPPPAAPSPVAPDMTAPASTPAPEERPKVPTKAEKAAAAAAEKARLDAEKREAEAAQAAEKREAEAAQAAEKREAEAARDAEKRTAEAATAEARIAAQQQAEQTKKDDEERRRNEKLQQERAKREAEVAKKNAEIARKQAEEEKKHDRALAGAADRLKQAQAAYEAEIQKTKTEQKPKDPGVR